MHLTDVPSLQGEDGTKPHYTCKVIHNYAYLYHTSTAQRRNRANVILHV